MGDIIRVIIDSREKEWIPTFLSKEFPNVTFEVKKLDEGDYLAECDNGQSMVLVERKQIGDFYSSIMEKRILKDGTRKNRMRDQVERISVAQSNSVVIYLITGDQNKFVEQMQNINQKVDVDILDGAIASLLVRDNIRVIIDYSDKGGLKRMVRIMQKICDGQLDLPKMRNCNMLAARLLNITRRQWNALKELHGTDLTYIASISEKELMKIEGIGKLRAKKIKEILTGTSEDWFD